MFKSAEQREQERGKAEEVRQARLAEQQRADERKARRELLATPVGGAAVAMDEGQAFYEVQLEVGRHESSASFGVVDGASTTRSSAQVLAKIEELGWRLEHANYVFVTTGEQSSSRMFGTGEASAVNGVTTGVYLFRNASAERPVGSQSAQE